MTSEQFLPHPTSQESGYSLSPVLRDEESVNSATSSESQRTATSGEQESHAEFWESLNKTIEDIFTEVDRLTALGAEKQQIHAGPQRRNGIYSRTKTIDDARMSTVSRDTDGQSETEHLRRPLEDDEYWSVSPTAWTRTPHVRQEVFSIVGRINETSEGEQAPEGDCKKCARSGAECMVYRDEVRSRDGDAVGLSCSRCRFRGTACSRELTGRPTRKKRKAVRFNGPISVSKRSQRADPRYTL